MVTAHHQVAPKSVLERVFAILDCFSARESELTLAELASRTAIPKPTVHRLAKILVEQRLLKRTEGGFALGIRLFELGELVGEQRDLRDASLPFLEELYELTHETIHLAVLEGNEVLYFVKIVGYKAFALPTRTGGRWPVHASALGKVLMAFGPADPLQLLPPCLKPLTPYTIIDPHRLQRELAIVRRVGTAIESQEAVLGTPAWPHRSLTPRARFWLRSPSAGHPCDSGLPSEHRSCAAPRRRSASGSAISCPRAGTDPARHPLGPFVSR